MSQMVDVWDLNVLPGKTRTHEIAGRYVTFKCQESAEFRLDEVSRIISNPGFKVQTKDGLPLSVSPVQVEGQGGQTVALRSDQVIAELRELTREALADRVEHATGKAPAKTIKREELVASLVRIRAGLGADEDAEDGEPV